MSDLENVEVWEDDEEDWDDEDDYLDDFEGDDEDLEDAIDSCHQTGDGICLAVGSEYCDFDCPFRGQMIHKTRR